MLESRQSSLEPGRNLWFDWGRHVLPSNLDFRKALYQLGIRLTHSQPYWPPARSWRRLRPGPRGTRDSSDTPAHPNGAHRWRARGGPQGRERRWRDGKPSVRFRALGAVLSVVSRFEVVLKLGED
jgi:hypothetical protein